MDVCSLLPLALIFVGYDVQWKQRWGVFQDFLARTDGYTAEEIAEWIRIYDVFFYIPPEKLEDIKKHCYVDSKPSFMMVCCFARDLGNYKSVRLACEAYTPGSKSEPDFVSVLGGEEPSFGDYCRQWVRSDLCEAKQILHG